MAKSKRVKQSRMAKNIGNSKKRAKQQEENRRILKGLREIK